jgi:hypothetical protein
MNSNDDVVDCVDSSLHILLHNDMIPLGPDFRSNKQTRQTGLKT